jgi:hypothetical protein
MAEYIEREAVLRAVQGQRSPCRSPAQNRMLDCLKAAVIRISAADVAPVVHAEWVVCGDGDNVPWMCSHCGKTTAHKYKVMYGKYCPHCGAKMDGGADHEDD